MRDTDTLSAQHGSDAAPAKKGGGLNEIKLKLAGWSYMLGDVALTLGSYLKNVEANNKLPLAERLPRHKLATGEVAGTAIWFAGGVAAAMFGNPNLEKQLQIHGSQLEDYLKKQGITIPDDARERNKLLKKKSFWDHTTQFLNQHPSEMLNLAYAIGAALLLRNGAKNIWVEKNPLKKEALFPTSFSLEGLNKMSSSFWMGALVLPGALIGMLAKEDKQAAKKTVEKDNRNIFEKGIAFVAEKPLRVSGMLYAANNFFLAKRAYTEFHNMRTQDLRREPFYLSSLTLACYLFSNAMLMMSDRNQLGKGMDPQAIAQLEDAGARVIAAQPLDTQQKLLEDVSKHLAAQKGMNTDAPTLASQMAQRIAELTNSRLQETATGMKWAARTQLPADSSPVMGK